MILNIYSIRDVKTNMYGNPMFLFNDGHAIRTVSDEVNRDEPGNMFHKHPGDFELFKLGTFDTEMGTFVPHAPTSVMLLEQLVKS